MDNIKGRLLRYIEAIGSNPRKFSISIGKSDGYIRTIKGSIGSDIIGDILRVYPSLNIYWLIIGEGEMLLSKDNSNVNYTEINKYLDRIERLSKEVGSLQTEVDRLKSLLNHQEGKNCKAG